jgi:general stress protein YciG
MCAITPFGSVDCRAARCHARLGTERIDHKDGIGWTVTRRSSRSRDLNSLAASLVEDATREGPSEPAPETAADTHRARDNGRIGGLKGGRTRAERLSPERRSEIARKAAQTRWATRDR